MPPLSLVINGAAGRMGQRLIALALQDPAWKLVGALESATHPKLGQDAGLIAGSGPIGVPLGAELPAAVDVVIDFSVPAATIDITRRCRERKLPLVVATTGLDPDEEQDVRAACRDIPLLWSPSMSLAVNLTMKLAEITARALACNPGGADVEIIERHHRFKEDAPSGTALKFGQIIAAQMGQTEHCFGREGRPGARRQNEIGYHAVRVGDNPGEHTIIFGLLGETIELTVKATSRDCYALGALAGAKFLSGKPPGLYGMKDVLGLEST